MGVNTPGVKWEAGASICAQLNIAALDLQFSPRTVNGEQIFTAVLSLYYHCTITVLSLYYHCTIAVLSGSALEALLAQSVGHKMIPGHILAL